MIALVRKHFIQKRVAQRYTPLECLQFDITALETRMGFVVTEDTFAQKVIQWLTSQDLYKQELEAATQYAAWAVYTESGQERHAGSTLFNIPEKLDFDQLILCNIQNGLSESPPSLQDQQHYRSTFDHYAPCPSQAYGMREAHYCLHCHKQEKDSCSKGLTEKNSFTFQINPLGNVLKGCPLNQKISEMNLLYTQAHVIGALSAITLDNPMVAATGYRICNDCSKACIFQKQEPVDIPSLETRILQDVLALPWGFEIYSLLTRWNPLNLHQPVPKPSSGYRVLVVGLGPAGFTLAHYLLNEGHEVFAIDGQKIEPLQDILKDPIFSAQAISQPLEERTIGGFGGVAEYGITSRWDKNNLTLIRLLLEKRTGFTFQSNTRFGSQITARSALASFDHIALCAGAGQPTMLDLANRFAPGVYLASDFLMSLHLQSFYRQEALASFKIQAPILVIGGGLTAIDAATEAQAYCHRQNQQFTDKTSLPNRVILVYRKSLQESPAYRLNHEEVQSALNQGVKYFEKASPLDIIVDEDGNVSGLRVRHEGQNIVLPAKTILIATGTAANTLYQKEQDFLNLSESEKDCLSFFGDLDPHYAGSVVKAMASAKEGAPQITRRMQARTLKGEKERNYSLSDFKQKLIATVLSNDQLRPQLREIVVYAPAAVNAFQPGQFFRLQNFEASAPRLNNRPLLMKGVALRPAWIDREKGVLGFVVQEVGASTLLCTALQKGEKISLMGPTGSAVVIPERQKILLIGGGLGNTALFALAEALKKKQNHVIQVAGYHSTESIIYQDRLESSVEQILWCWQQQPQILVKRPQDLSFEGNVVEGLIHCAQQELLNLEQVDLMIVSGSDQMMAALQTARQGVLKPYLNPHHTAVCFVNTRMQCMMKGICGQCIQRQYDPISKQEQVVFSCIHSHQVMDQVDFKSLTQRLHLNTEAEGKKYNWLKQKQ